MHIRRVVGKFSKSYDSVLQASKDGALRDRTYDGVTNFDIGNRRLNSLDFIGSTFYNCIFNSIELSGTKFVSCLFDHCRFINSCVQRANFNNADMKYVICYGGTFALGSFEYLHADNVEFDCILDKSSFRGADLSGVDFTNASFQGAMFGNAKLKGTCLDPCNVPNGQASEFERAPSGKCIGYRTSNSPIIDEASTRKYKPNTTYRAPVFSTSNRACHPGLYVYPRAGDVVEFASYNTKAYQTPVIIKVYFNREDLHKAGNKYRVREFVVAAEKDEIVISDRVREAYKTYNKIW